MRSGTGHPDVAIYRATQGQAGLNLTLSDLYDTDIELPSVKSVIKSLFTGKRLEARVLAKPITLIRKLMAIQKIVDEKVEEEIEKAKSKGA